MLHAPRDATVGIENASGIFLAARHPKSFITLDDADHLVTCEADATYAADIIATWSSRYLGTAVAPEVGSAPGGIVRVSEHDAGGFRQDVSIGVRHRLLADEPEEVGGTDTGPNPYDLLSAGLGACTAMTIRLYARRKAIPLTHVAVDVRHDRDHLKDCADCDQNAPKVDVFTRIIRLQGDLSDDQNADLLRIADKCPVHRTLVKTSVVETVLEE